MAFRSAPSAVWSVSLLIVLIAAAVHSNIVDGKLLPLPLSVHPPPILSVSLWRSPGPLTSPTLSFSLRRCPLSVDLRLFRCFLFYDKGITEPLISTWDTPTLPGPQWNFCRCFCGMCVTCTWAQGHTHTLRGPAAVPHLPSSLSL